MSGELDLTTEQKIEIGVRFSTAHRMAIEKGVLPMPGTPEGDLVTEAAVILLCGVIGIDYYDESTNDEFTAYTEAVLAAVQERGL